MLRQQLIRPVLDHPHDCLLIVETLVTQLLHNGLNLGLDQLDKPWLDLCK